jgi:hypothetical protein
MNLNLWAKSRMFGQDFDVLHLQNICKLCPFFFSFCPFFYFRKGGHPGNICLCPSLLGVRNIYDVLEQFSLEPKKSDCYLCFLSSPSRQPVYKSTITILCQERLVSKSPNFTLFAYFLYLFS